MSNTKERWVPVYLHEGMYEVSDLGQIRRLKDDVMMHGHRRDSMNPRVTLSYHSSGTSKKEVGQVVLESFGYQKPPRYKLSFIDGIRTNSELANLLWEPKEEYITRRVNLK